MKSAIIEAANYIQSRTAYLPDTRAYIDDLAQRLRAEASGWQPIETAPKDGRWLILGSRRCCFMGYRDDVGFWRDQRDAYRDPTHWMPLPSPPASKVES